MGRRLAATVEVGHLLHKAKRSLPHGEWLPLLRKLGLNPRSAQTWIRVARKTRFTNASLDSRLPACVTTLNAISRLSDEDYSRDCSQTAPSMRLSLGDPSQA
jgi:hypothetical protein